ncbi:MAG: InlB B-repeat-containing protein, partial [Alphaproteobacteria bacterium]
TRDGYTFKSWTENGTAITQIVKGTTGNKTLVAQWNDCGAGNWCANGVKTACSTYGANYTTDSANATRADDCYQPCTIACTQPVCPENSANCVIIPSEISGEQYFGGECNATNRTCEFTFDCANGYTKSDDGLSCIVIEYDITYELNGGVNDESNPIKYNVETDTITLSAPKRSGYTFHGWYDNAEFAGEPVTQIVRASTSHKSFYAKWNECAIGYYCADGAQNKCPDGFSSNAGADSADDCNIKLQKLHIGNNTMYLTPNKPDTLPVMAFGIGDSVYYGGLSDSERTLHNDATIKYNIMLDGKQKYLYDLTAD